MLRRSVLKRTFRLAEQSGPIPEQERSALLHSLYQKNKRKENPTRRELSALGQASLTYVNALLDLCETHQVRVFGSVFPCDGIPTQGTQLRKDYAYLFQRVYLHLRTVSETEKGIIVFDELDKSQSLVLMQQMRRYFLDTKHGKERGKHIIPEPFFVHSDLTTATQVADIIAYIINYGISHFHWEHLVGHKKRIYERKPPTRKEMEPFGKKVQQLQFNAVAKGAQRRSQPSFSMAI